MSSKVNSTRILLGICVLYHAICFVGRANAAPNERCKDDPNSAGCQEVLNGKIRPGAHMPWVAGMCGGTNDTVPGKIFHPMMSGSYYHNNEICTWIVRSPLPLAFYFSKFNMEADYDHVSIRDGGSIGSPLIRTVTGKSLHYNFTTAGDAHIQFESDQSVVGIGFVLHYRIYSAEGQCEDKNGVCVQNGDRCDSVFEMIENSCDDRCACCVPDNQDQFENQ